MSWALPLPLRPFGIPIRVHLFFFVVAAGFFLRQVVFEKDNIVAWETVLLFVVFVLFGIVLLHEWGHCLAGWAVGGQPNEILIWPLGGLAFVDVPQNWRAHTLTAVGGPAVNAVVCGVCAVILLFAGFYPNANPLANPYVSEVRGFDHRVYSSEYALKLYKAGTAEEYKPEDFPESVREKVQDAHEKLRKKDFQGAQDTAVTKTDGLIERALAPLGVVWVQRVFWLSWVLLLVNLIPAYPLDGGQIAQGLLWWRSDYRQATAVAAYCGYIVSVLLLIGGIAANEVFLAMLGAFVFYCSAMKLVNLDADEAGYGDFSQGYLSLEKEEPPPKPKRVNPIKRWLQARAARRLQREIEQRQREDERMDQLLEKIARSGKQSLTEEEKRFMERVAARYRNR